MSKKSATILEDIRDLLVEIDAGDVLTGSFKSKRKVNKKGIEKYLTVFGFDGLPGKAGRLKYRGKGNSILGTAENIRLVGSGNMKLDYSGANGKIAEVSVEKSYVDELSDFKSISGSFRINRSSDDLILCDQCDGNFSKDKILTVDFEVDI